MSIWIMEFNNGDFTSLLEFMEMLTKVLDAGVESGTLYHEREMANMTELRYQQIHTKAIWNADTAIRRDRT